MPRRLAYFGHGPTRRVTAPPPSASADEGSACATRRSIGSRCHVLQPGPPGAPGDGSTTTNFLTDGNGSLQSYDALTMGRPLGQARRRMAPGRPDTEPSGCRDLWLAKLAAEGPL